MAHAQSLMRRIAAHVSDFAKLSEIDSMLDTTLLLLLC